MVEVEEVEGLSEGVVWAVLVVVVVVLAAVVIGRRGNNDDDCKGPERARGEKRLLLRGSGSEGDSDGGNEEKRDVDERRAGDGCRCEYKQRW